MDYEKDMNEARIDTGKGTVYCRYRDVKAATSLVLVHGLASSTLTWKRLVGCLPGRINVYLMDLLGHGESDAPDIEYTVDVQAEALDSLVSHLGIRNPYVFGHSYGGWVSALYSMHYPVKGIILEDSAGLKSFYDEVKGDALREKYKEEMLEKALSLGANRHVVEYILNDEFTEHQLERSDLESLSVPALVIWGKDDDVIKEEYAREFVSGIRGSELKIIAGARHTPHYTHAPEVCKLVSDFMGYLD